MVEVGVVVNTGSLIVVVVVEVGVVVNTGSLIVVVVVEVGVVVNTGSLIVVVGAVGEGAVHPSSICPSQLLSFPSQISAGAAPQLPQALTVHAIPIAVYVGVTTVAAGLVALLYGYDVTVAVLTRTGPVGTAVSPSDGQRLASG